MSRSLSKKARDRTTLPVTQNFLIAPTLESVGENLYCGGSH